MLLAIETAQQFAKIRRGQHVGWRGDHVRNSEFFLRLERKKAPQAALHMAADIRRQLSEYVDATDLPERSLLIAANVLDGTFSGA